MTDRIKELDDAATLRVKLDREAFEAWWTPQRGGPFDDERSHAAARAAWLAALAHARSAEPVAWMALVDGVVVQTAISGDQMREHYSHVVPLYAAPVLDDEGMRLLERVFEREYNPFEPDNQSKLYYELKTYLAKHK